METIHFSTSKDRDSLQLDVEIPNRADASLQKYTQIMKRVVSKGSGKVPTGILAESTPSGSKYSIMPRVIGGLEYGNKKESLRRSLDLILIVQMIGRSIEVAHTQPKEMSDPVIRLKPTISPHLVSNIEGSKNLYDFTALLRWSPAAFPQLPELQIAAGRALTVTHHDLLDPKGNGSLSTKRTGVIANPRDGILLRIGENNETVGAPKIHPSMPALRIEGLLSSHEHELAVAMGAVAMADALQLATD